VTDQTLTLRNVEIDGLGGLDVRINGARIVEIAVGLRGGSGEIDGRGGALIPGLIDHHVHLLATAARADSVSLDGVSNRDQIGERLRAHAVTRAAGAWIRALDCPPHIAASLDRLALDAIFDDRPLRMQDQSGALWILNSRALDKIQAPFGPPGLERDYRGAPVGRLWRGDAWLRGEIGETAPPMRPIGERLAAMGVTGVMDASVSNNAGSAEALATAIRAGDLPQRLRLMSAGPLAPPADQTWRIGPVKVMLDDRDLPPLDAFIDQIVSAHAERRPVAVHCVTATQLALTLAAFDVAGSSSDDRIEHGGVIPLEAIGDLKRFGLTVITQPSFVHDRGGRYLAEVDPHEQGDIYRCASLLRSGVRVAASSDAPYGDLDPWAGMRAAVLRQSRRGLVVASDERVPARRALSLYLGGFSDPGGPPRRVAVGEPADLCLLKTPLAEALDTLSADIVAATIVGGRLAYQAP